MKFQSASKRKLIVEEEIIDDQPQQKNTKSDDDKIVGAVEELVVPSSANHSKWKVKDSKPLPKKTSLLGIVKTNKNHADTTKPEAVSCKVNDTKATEVKAAPSGLGLLGAYTDSENSDE